jgi:hypothetical protein
MWSIYKYKKFSKCSDCTLLGCDTVQFCKWILTFRRNMLPPCTGSTLKIETECSFETFITTYKTTRRHNPDDHNLNTRFRKNFLKLISNISKLGLNSVECNNVFSDKMKPFCVSTNDGHHRKATNTSKEVLHMY